MIKDFVSDFFTAIQSYSKVPSFTKRYQVWQGFTQHKIVLVALFVVAFLFGALIWKTIWNWWSNFHSESVIEAGLQTAGLIGDLASTGYDFAFAGAYKYLVLIVMELLIFHIAIRTNGIISGEKGVLTAGVFMKAQIRMIKVSIFVFVMELVASIVLGVALGIIGLSFLKPILTFFVQCYFLGFALIDNYNEINHLSIRDSFRETRLHPGAAFGIGLILYLLILVPLVGPILGPMLGAVAATLTMYAIERDQSIDQLINVPARI